MKVWVVLGNYAYSHGEVAGVFSTEEKAKEAAQKCHEGASSPHWDFEVLPFEMDHITLL